MVLRRSMSAYVARRLSLLPAALLLLCLILTGCDLPGGSTPRQPQPQQPGPTNTAGSSASTATIPAAGQAVTPGTPGCDGEPAPCPTPNAGATAEVPTVVGQPVAQPPPAVITPFVIYADGKLAAGWSDASYSGTRAEYASGEASRDGYPAIKVMISGGWGAFSLADWNNTNVPELSKYTHLHFWINGGPSGGQRIGVALADTRLHLEKYIKGGRVPANGWAEVFIPLDDLGITSGQIGRITFQDVSGGAQPPYYMDGLEFYRDNSAPPTPIVTTAEVTVDLNSNRHPISPYIYGMSLAPEDVAKDANITLNRLGGNPYSTYNWTLGNARNAGSDWEFRNYSREPNDPAYKLPSGLADMAFKTNKAMGADTLLTVPMLGYVAKDDNNDHRSTNIASGGGAPVAPGSEAIQGYDPKANQDVTSVKSFPAKGSAFQDPPGTSGPVYQDEWINHLVKTFGNAANGGVRFYAMDNEPDLWADDTHIDLHPVRPGYDDMLKNFTDYATAVKAVDPTAQVTGPVVSGWTGYWFSALDRGSDSFKTAADRHAHGNVPFLAWWLDAVRKHDEQIHQRTLDVLDIHYYPQAPGLAENKTDTKTGALRLRSTRSLWDPAYVDESWIARTEQSNVDLIPRMKDWIDTYYPGTKLGITEWNFGAEETMNGALAIADVLGIYGREDVYLASYWTNPPLNSPGESAFKIYRNFDGNKGTFGDVSVGAQSPDPDKLSVFASEDTKTHQVKLVVLNKTEHEQLATTLNLRGGSFAGSAKLYQMSTAGGTKIQPMPNVPVTNSTITYSFPPYSITLLVIDETR